MTLYANFLHQLKTIKDDIVLLNETITNALTILLEKSQELSQNFDDISNTLSAPPITKILTVGKNKQFEHPTEALEFITTQSTAPHYHVQVDPLTYLFPYFDKNINSNIPAILNTPHKVTFESTSQDQTIETIFQMGQNSPPNSTVILFARRAQGTFHNITFRGASTLSNQNLPQKTYQALLVKQYATLNLENCRFYNFYTAVLATLHGEIIAKNNHSHQNVNFCQLTLNSRAHIDHLSHTGLLPNTIAGNEKYLYSGCSVSLNSKGCISNSSFSNVANGALLAQYGGVIQSKNNEITSKFICIFAINGGHFQGYQTKIITYSPYIGNRYTIYSMKGFNFFKDIRLENTHDKSPFSLSMYSSFAGTVLYESPQVIDHTESTYGKIKKL